MTKREGTKIDKSALAIGLPPRGRIDRTAPELAVREPKRAVDPAYRQSAQGRPCDVWGCANDPATVVGAHLRMTLPEFPGAGSRKPHDGLIAYLCHFHHDATDGRMPMTLDAREDMRSRLLIGLLLRMMLREFPDAYEALTQYMPVQPHGALDRGSLSDAKNRLIAGLLMQRYRAFQADRRRGENP